MSESNEWQRGFEAGLSFVVAHTNLETKSNFENVREIIDFVKTSREVREDLAVLIAEMESQQWLKQ